MKSANCISATDVFPEEKDAFVAFHLLEDPFANRPDVRGFVGRTRLAGDGHLRNLAAHQRFRIITESDAGAVGA